MMLEYGYSLHGQVSRCPALQCPMGPAIEGQAAGYKRERPPTARGNDLRSHQAAPSPGVQKWGIAIYGIPVYPHFDHFNGKKLRKIMGNDDSPAGFQAVSPALCSFLPSCREDDLLKVRVHQPWCQGDSNKGRRTS